MRIKVLHVINWLNLGGAEVMLCNLLEKTDRARFEPVVCTLVDVMPLADRVRAVGVPVHTVAMRPGVPDPRGVLRLARLVRSERPDLVQTWLYQSDLIGGLAARISTGAPVVWGVHHTYQEPATVTRLKQVTISACARLSRYLPERIVCCSDSARLAQLSRGYAAGPMEVIYNGFDLDVFRPDAAAGPSLRAELGLGRETRLVGLVARFDPQKDHETFLRAARLLALRFADVHFILCGNHVDDGNPALVKAVGANGLGGRCRLLGPRRDVPRVLAGLDLVCSSSSSGEAFPMVLGEAMASGKPCVTTDVGDSALIVGETGRVVPPRDPHALADACAVLLGLPAGGLADAGRAARNRIQNHFSISSTVGRYEELYQNILAGRRRHPVATRLAHARAGGRPGA